MDRRLKIAGKEWLVRVSRLRGKAAGWCDYRKRKILVDSLPDHDIACQVNISLCS